MSTPTPRNQSDKAKTSQALDEALEESFPASDPIAFAPKQGGKDDKRVEGSAPSETETTDAKTASNMRTFHKAFERRRR